MVVAVAVAVAVRGGVEEKAEAVTEETPVAVSRQRWAEAEVVVDGGRRAILCELQQEG